MHRLFELQQSHGHMGIGDVHTCISMSHRQVNYVALRLLVRT